MLHRTSHRPLSTRRLSMACLALLVSLPLAGEARADACDDLIQALGGALADPSLSADAKGQIEALLEAGQNAKSKGNTDACEAALAMPMQSPAPGQGGSPAGNGGHDCEKTPNTV